MFLSSDFRPDRLDKEEEKKVSNPCLPSPCGPYSVCQAFDNRAACSCQPNYVGSPPSCRPECSTNSECSRDKSCVNNRCQNPCPGTCGYNAQCRVVNHNPICSCNIHFTGDPFVECRPEPSNIPSFSNVKSPNSYVTQPITVIVRPPILADENPCVPSPCGQNANCRIKEGHPVCSCLPNYIGRPPSCRPECMVHSDCSSSLACINERCSNPCLGACGPNAECRVQSHIPRCTCAGGYTGDPFSGCFQDVLCKTTSRAQSSKNFLNSPLPLKTFQ